MPIFFYLSGYFTWISLRRHAVNRFVASRWENIVYPYLVWSFLTVLVHVAMAPITKINHDVSFHDLLTIGWDPINILWFLYALLVMQLLAVVASKHPRRLLGAALLLSAAATVSPDVIRHSIAGKVALHIPFYALGFALASAGLPALPRIRRKWLSLGILTLMWLGGVTLAMRVGFTDPITFVLIPVSVVGMMALSIIATAFLKSGALGRHVVLMGNASLPIYLLHVFTLAVVPRLLRSVGFNSPLGELMVGTLVGVYGSWLVFLAVRAMRVDGIAGLTPKKAPRLLFLQRG